MSDLSAQDSSKEMAPSDQISFEQPLAQAAEVGESEKPKTKESKAEIAKKAKEAKAEAKNVFVGQNVFTNDGNFLQRFKRAKDELDEKDEREKSLKRKQELERRIKNRGKRRKDKSAQVEADSYTIEGELSSAATAYLNEMKHYSEKMGNS
ncbi:hypothetical protein DSO57_1015904 [Entomophthora muscae]|uniref:Uncharacterized protein n=1 Tax=Entomophthora muscae TaxID=34485 RepID=A0ACC2RW99_9FUNG|nr:hypothetical protein DSO57_1015904 [Entomophthora muscae]